MDGLAEFVLDAKLETLVVGNDTEHILYDVAGTSRQRPLPRRERWKREKKAIGRGSYGIVWLESCGTRQRAVKEIFMHRRRVNVTDCGRELEALCKFSRQKVSKQGFSEFSRTLILTEYFLSLRDVLLSRLGGTNLENLSFWQWSTSTMAISPNTWKCGRL